MSTSTYVFPCAHTDLDAVATAYAGADRAGKAAMKAHAKSAMAAAIDALDLPAAAAWRDADKAMVVTSDKVPTDYAGLVRVRVAAMVAAVDLIKSGAVTPDGLPDDFDIASVDFTVAPDADLVATMAATMAGAKVARSSVRNAIGDAIVSVTSDKPGAWFTMGDIAKAASLPSSGAVAAHLTVRGEKGDPVVWNDDRLAEYDLESSGDGTPGNTRKVRYVA